MIYAEQLGAKAYNASGHFLPAFLSTLPVLLIGAVSLVLAYMLGLKHFQNIWVVSAVSIGSILLVEPLFNFFYIGDVPTLGAGVGFILGVLGILATLFL